MITKQTLRLAAVVLALVVLPLGRTSPALAAVPGNDDFNSATAISSLPYSNAVSTVDATRASDDPYTSCGVMSDTRTVWYSFTPSADMSVDVNTVGSNYDTVLAAYTGSGGNLTEVGCNDQAGDRFSPNQSRVLLRLTGGTTYYFMVAAYDRIYLPSRDLVFNITEPAMSVTLWLNPTGSVTGKTGVARVSGSFSCSYPGTVDITGSLLQQGRKGSTISGSFQLTGLWCYGAGYTTDWATDVSPTSGKFGRGDASLSATADATDSALNIAASHGQGVTVSLGR